MFKSFLDNYFLLFYKTTENISFQFLVNSVFVDKRAKKAKLTMAQKKNVHNFCRLHIFIPFIIKIVKLTIDIFLCTSLSHNTKHT